MKRRKFMHPVGTGLCLFFTIIILSGCEQKNKSPMEEPTNWKEQFNEKLPILGHRNWILVVDKAYPEQTASGIETIYTNEELLPVLKYVKSAIDSSKHVEGEFFTDKELSFLTNKEVPGVSGYRDSVISVIGKNANEILHDTVFVKIDAASKLFKILVLKTNQTIPYSSVFIRLNCAYWDAEKEKALRGVMNK